MKNRIKSVTLSLRRRDRNAIDQLIEDRHSWLRTNSALVNYILAKFFEGKADKIFEELTVPGSDMKYKGSQEEVYLTIEIGSELFKASKKLAKEKKRSISAQIAYLVQLVLEGKEQELQNEWGGGTK